MDLKMTRINILKEIVELYKDTNEYDLLLELLNNNEDIASLLKSKAVVYYLLMTNSPLVWNNIGMLECDNLARYQKGYQLYVKYACYFLGAVVIHPSLELVVNPDLKDCSLLNNGHIDYSVLLSDINIYEEMKLA